MEPHRNCSRTTTDAFEPDLFWGNDGSAALKYSQIRLDSLRFCLASHTISSKINSPTYKWTDFWMIWDAKEAARLSPCDDDKTQSAENPPLEASLNASVVV